MSEPLKVTERTMGDCPACGGARFTVLLTPEELEAERRWLVQFHRDRVKGDASDKDRVEFTQSESTFVMRCETCGTVMRNPRPTASALRRRYRFDRYGEETLEQLLDNEHTFFVEKVAWLSTMLPPGAAVVEVGSFVGAFLDASRDSGWEPTGVDIGKETAEFARSRGHTVLEDELVSADLPSGAFDCVAIWNTFDQVAKPGALLDACLSLLKPDGLLVIRFPNGLFESEALEVRRCPRRADDVMIAQAYNNFLTFPYLAGYTPDSIKALLTAHGFAVGEMRGDTILPLATPDTKDFAVEEERRTKRRLMRFLSACEQRTGRSYYPWLDILARPATVSEGPPAGRRGS